MVEHTTSYATCIYWVPCTDHSPSKSGTLWLYRLCMPIGSAWTMLAQICPCVCGRTDFLLIRDSAGRISVREFTGTVLAGQEEPRIRVPPPRSKEKKCECCPHCGCDRSAGLCVDFLHKPTCVANNISTLLACIQLRSDYQFTACGRWTQVGNRDRGAPAGSAPRAGASGTAGHHREEEPRRPRRHDAGRGVVNTDC